MNTKASLRQECLALRDAERDRERKSHAIQRRLLDLPEFLGSQRVAFYVGVRSEVATRDALDTALNVGKHIGVVYRDRDNLGVCLIHAITELTQGSFGLWEPPTELRSTPERQLRTKAVDLFVIPGLAFDRRGGRLGYGRGYYDRFLAESRPDAHRIALAFDAQVLDEVPMGPRDQRVHLVVTEGAVYRVSP